MNRQLMAGITIALVAVLMLFFNRKVNLIRLFIKQLDVFKDARTGKRSVWDVLCFFVFPIVIAISIVFGMSFKITTQLAELLTTVFSLVFTILFGFAAVIVEKRESDNAIKKRVVSETFVSIITATALSLLAALVSIILTSMTGDLYVSVLSVILLAISIHIIMLLLMITKRTFVIYCEGDQDN